MPPMLRWALGRLPVGHDEKQRVEREALDERGFVAKLERLLVLVDDSRTGKFTAYLAGLVGGAAGMPTTLLQLKDAEVDRLTVASASELTLKEIKKGAEKSARAVKKTDDTLVDKVHLTARTAAAATGKMVAEEARKGYGMLLIGLDKVLTEKGSFTPALGDITSGFDGPLCLVLDGAREGDRMPSLRAGATILVPVNGTEVARRAADFALTLARSNRARVKVLYVSQGKGQRRTFVSHRREEAVLKDIADLAARYGVPVDTAIRTRNTPDKAIVREVAKGAALVVMGVTQRPGDELYFGDTASAVLAASSCPVILLASERIKRASAAAETDVAA
jgi:nucleotide-binding universal stress UspA family protein